MQRLPEGDIIINKPRINPTGYIMSRSITLLFLFSALMFVIAHESRAADSAREIAFFEKKIRPLLAKHCYRCHSEAEKRQRGGLLLDRKSGWLKGGDTGKAVVPGKPDESLLIHAVRYKDEDLQMPPRSKLEDDEVRLLETWVKNGAHAPSDQTTETEFTRLGDQKYLFGKAKDHWAFQPVKKVNPPQVEDRQWNQGPIDQFVFAELMKKKLTPSSPAEGRSLIRRLSYDLTGLPPDAKTVDQFVKDASVDRERAIQTQVDRLIDSPAFGEQFARMWLDVARYADTDSFYRPDTRTPHYFPFAFTYRDYVIDSFNRNRPYDEFVRQQLAADLMGFKGNDPELAALGFMTVGPHANRNPLEALDDWIDVTTRGLMGMTTACARCHDHKYEPIPTEDYYSLHGVFSSIIRVRPLDEKNQPQVSGYDLKEKDRADYAKKRAAIDAKIKAAGGKTSGGNNRSVATKIRETELAELLLFHPGAPVHAMVVREKGRAVEPFVQIRGERRNRGKTVPRRFLRILDPEQKPFPADNSGRLALANQIVDPKNPLTARVFVNRVWGALMGSYLVDSPSNFGLQGSTPTHPELLDWLTQDFTSNGWSVKRLVRRIVLSRTYQQSSDHREDAAAIDPQNKALWRANRKHLSIEQMRDSLLAVAGQLDLTPRGRAGKWWGEGYTRRRAIYGYVNRFNLDPTLRTFDFANPMQTQPTRNESIVPSQALFTLNAPFVIDQANAITASEAFVKCETDPQRIRALFKIVFQRSPKQEELVGIRKFVAMQQRVLLKPGSQIKSPWPLVAQALVMSNEFQYVD